MNNSTPKISVLMPAYNAEKYIAEAIESILCQTFKDFEFIIIDDCSTDKTWEIIQDYTKKDERIKAFKNEENLKTTKTLNKGFKIAKGKYIVRMDADDWSYPERLEKQYNFMEKNPDVVLSGSAIEICDEKLKIKNKRKYNLNNKTIREKIFRYSQFCHPATIWRKNTVEKAGFYNEFLPLAQDYEFYFRMGIFGNFANMEDVLHKLRTHSNSSSIKRGKDQEIIALYSRIKAQVEYGYKMTAFDKIYLGLQYISIFFIPVKLRFWIFNFLRKF